MKTNIPERIAALREAMRQQKVDAYHTQFRPASKRVSGRSLEIERMDIRLHRLGGNDRGHRGQGGLMD